MNNPRVDGKMGISGPSTSTQMYPPVGAGRGRMKKSQSKCDTLQIHLELLADFSPLPPSQALGNTTESSNRLLADSPTGIHVVIY